MDPKANLKEQLECAARMLDDTLYTGGPDDNDWASDALRLAELVTAMHEWRSKGGFDPYGN